jgi:glycosyltransferase involved in cell wall biosynthesis
MTSARDPRLESRGRTRPDFSVIVPTHSRTASLRACLDGIAHLDTDVTRFEVLVIDDGGGDPLEPILALYRGRFLLQLIVRPRGGPGAARNDGAAAAKGRFLAFIDDDCVPSPQWLAAYERELAHHPEHLLGGSIANNLPDNPYSSASHRIITYVQAYYQTDGGNEPFFQTSNLAVSADKFRELGGFDVSIPSATAEDKEFCHRWRAAGHKMSHVADAIVHHSHNLTLRSFLRQHYNYGRGIAHVRLMHLRLLLNSYIPEPFAFYRGLLFDAPSHRSLRIRLRDTLLMIVSQMATLMGAAKTVLLERPRNAQRPAARSYDSLRPAGTTAPSNLASGSAAEAELHEIETSTDHW